MDQVIEMTADSDDPTMRRFKCRGRFPAPDFSARLESDGYVLATAPAATVSVEDRVFAWIMLHPGKASRAVQSGVGGKSARALAAIHTLEAAGRIHNQSGKNGGAAWYAIDPSASGNSPSGNAVGSTWEAVDGGPVDPNTKRADD